MSKTVVRSRLTNGWAGSLDLLRAPIFGSVEVFGSRARLAGVGVAALAGALCDRGDGHAGAACVAAAANVLGAQIAQRRPRRE